MPSSHFLVSTVILWGGYVDREVTLKAKDFTLYHGSAIEMLQGHAKSFKFSEPLLSGLINWLTGANQAADRR